MGKRFTLNSRGNISTHYDSYEEAFVEKWGPWVILAILVCSVSFALAFSGDIFEWLGLPYSGWIGLALGSVVGVMLSIVATRYMIYIVYALAACFVLGVLYLIGTIVVFLSGT